MEATEARRALDREREETLRQVAALIREFDGIVAASESDNADDEHDPEGATIAFERAQVSTLLAQARRRLDEVDAAIARVEGGSYGRCEGCGDPIAPARLEARPAARTCIGCAR